MNMGELLKAVASCFSATKLLSKEQRRVGGLDTKLHQSTARLVHELNAASNPAHCGSCIGDPSVLMVPHGIVW